MLAEIPQNLLEIFMQKTLPLFLLIFPAFTFAAIPSLPSLNIEKNSITVSGISSGAFMAVQLQVALSSKIKGMASIAGGIYACSEGNAATAKMLCMKDPSKLQSEKFIAKAKEEEKNLTIDPLSFLKEAKIFLFQSELDPIVHYPAVDKLEEFFSAFSPKKRTKRTTDKAGHGFPTMNYGQECNRSELPWLIRCNRDLAGEILNYFYPDLKNPVDINPKNIFSFDQSLYSEPQSLIKGSASVYVPKNCQAGRKCHLHIALHGCLMSPEFVQDKFIWNAGYNYWAESNDIVVLYPYVSKSELNPYGCWDWTGYTGPNFAMKSGKQISAIENMIEAITEP